MQMVMHAYIFLKQVSDEDGLNWKVWKQGVRDVYLCNLNIRYILNGLFE